MPRKYTSSFRTGRTIGSGFNEAGADAPEIPSSPQRLLLWQTSFNEAGADAPEIPRPCHWACGLEFRPFLRVVQVFNLVWSLKIGL